MTTQINQITNEIKNQLPTEINMIINMYAGDHEQHQQIITEIPAYVKYTHRINCEDVFKNWIMRHPLYGSDEFINISELYPNPDTWVFSLSSNCLTNVISYDECITLVDNQNCTVCDVDGYPDVYYYIKQQASSMCAMKLYTLIPIIHKIGIVRRCNHMFFDGITRQRNGEYAIYWGS